MLETVEQALLKTLNKVIRNKMGDAVKNLVSGQWETESDAKYLVGYIKACDELEFEFTRIIKDFFPT